MGYQFDYRYEDTPEGRKYYGFGGDTQVTDTAVLQELQAGKITATPKDAPSQVPQAEIDAYNQQIEAGKTNTGVQAPAGTTFVNGAPYAAGNTPITSSSLNTSAPINYQSPNPSSTYPVASLGSTPGISANGQMTLTPEEQKAQDYNTKLQDLNNQLLGESAYRSEQENAQGLGDLNKTRQDLTSQLNALKNEAMAIPLQAQNQAEGRGVTAGGLRPVEAAAARNNAIQALTVNSLLEATNGNISTALQMVERAVAQKFDPIKEQIKVAQANLELILNSPQASIEDKNRALAQKAIQDAKADQLSQDRENWENVQKIALDAAAAGVDALTLRKIQSATDPVQAAQIAAQAGVYTAAGGEANDFTLSPGQTRYDAEGNVVAQADPKETPADTSSIGPNQAAAYTAQGYKGITPNMTKAEADAAVASQIKPAAPSGYPTTNLEPGSTNTAAVRQLQSWLVANGYMTQADMNTGPGIYGPKTTAAVAKVQSQYGVDNTGAVGYWGPKTQAALKGGAPAPVTKPESTSSSSSFGTITNSDEAKGMNWLLANGASQEEINLFKTDREFQAQVLQQANAKDEDLDSY